MKRFCQKICATVFVLMHTLERAESLGKKKLSLSRPRAQRKPMPKAPKAPGVGMATSIYPPGSSIPYPYPRKKIIPATIPIPVCGYEIVPIPVPVG